MTTEGNTDKAKAELVRLLTLALGVSDKRARPAVESLINLIADERAFCELVNALTAGKSEKELAEEEQAYKIVGAVLLAVVQTLRRRGNNMSVELAELKALGFYEEDAPEGSELEREKAAMLKSCLLVGAALAHEAIVWHGKELIKAFLRSWKGRDEEAIVWLLPAFEQPDDEDYYSPAILKRKYGRGMDKEKANSLFQEWATAFHLERARGFYLALKLLIPTDDESGREILLGEPLDGIGVWLRAGARYFEKKEEISLAAMLDKFVLLDELDPDNGEQT